MYGNAPKSLAEFKRIIDRYTCELVFNSLMGGEIPETHVLKHAKRKVIKKQTNAVQFEGGSWYEYPLSKDIVFIDNNSFDHPITGFSVRTNFGDYYMIHKYEKID